MTWWNITYTCEERSVFQARVEADSPENALVELRGMADTVGGYQNAGAYLRTVETEPDLESFDVTSADGPLPWPDE